MDTENGSSKGFTDKAFCLVIKKDPVGGVVRTEELKVIDRNLVICIDGDIIKKLQIVYGGEIREEEVKIQDGIAYRRNGFQPAPIFSKSDFEKLVGGWYVFGRAYFASDHNLAWG